MFPIFLAMVFSCDEAAPETPGTDVPEIPGEELPEINGEWMLVSFGESEPGDINVYVSFDNGTFELYQNLGSGKYYLYTGNYTLDNTVLRGQYRDGTSWGSDYDVDVESDSLVLTARNGSGEVSVYTRKDIPEEVTGSATMKSSMKEAPTPFL